MTCCVALLRGINVGKAKRIAMVDLRDLVANLGHTDVRTLLNSGNVVFEAARPNVTRLARTLENAIKERFGFAVPVVVLTAAQLEGIAAANPLARVAKDASKYLVAFVGTAQTLAAAKDLLKQSWKPDALALGDSAAYLWCANGIIESRLVTAFSRATGGAATTRNWATVEKLLAATRAGDSVA